MEFIISMDIVWSLVLILLIAGIVMAAKKQDALKTNPDKIKINVEDLNKTKRKTFRSVKNQMAGEPDLPARKPPKSRVNSKPSVFVIDFKGDVNATGSELFKASLNAAVQQAKEGDEVMIRLESQGGSVAEYGYLSTLLEEIKDQPFQLTVCVDKVAASGGYLMACVADKVVAAPFAYIGSIGVVAQVPNVHELLERYGITVKDYTAGESKRTVSMTGEIKAEDEKKFTEQLEAIHEQFKAHVAQHRSQVDIEAVATGESWTAKNALDHQLIDEIGTSNAYLQGCMKEMNAYQIKATYPLKQKTLKEVMSASVSQGIEKVAQNLIQNRIQ
ncbi:protease SohB (plasmid) [Neptuniibacter sp. QD72_48]|uniref:protease SohB n=1 Tax=Neptuniibacter sp. QD72_48 TaxID=3398214 RepID=UPI0039F4BE09